ncbi:TPA: hypothetical protein DCS99_04135 [Candidatus Wolfebacteria bacterium]|nr:hypothetical protein [Candidatus Wolfebacteria bacterium]
MMRELQPGVREIRAMDPKDVVKAIRGLRIFPHVEVLNRQSLAFLQRLHGRQIIVANDEASRSFVEHYFPEESVVKESVFLRWDPNRVKLEVKVNFDWRTVDLADKEAIRAPEDEGQKTSCWWRQVGAAVIHPESRQVLLMAHNKHLPSEHTPYAVGDPRDFVRAGTSPELASTIHAEAGIVARAAREGIPLKGMHLYVTVFPCTPCAGLVAESGISRLYFSSGCAYLEGESILRSRGVEIVHVA